jgi:hypothetical protein
MEECANLAVSGLIHENSKQRYELVYKKLPDWCQQRKVNIVNEKIMLTYFASVKILKASTLQILIQFTFFLIYFSMFAIIHKLIINKSLDDAFFCLLFQLSVTHYLTSYVFVFYTTVSIIIL